MNRTTIIAAMLVLLVAAVALMLPPLSSSPALAAEQTVTLAVDNMYCAACPFTVKTAMQRVSGVKDVKVDFNTKQAVVTFDSTKTTVDAVAAASTNVGYPAHVVKASN